MVAKLDSHVFKERVVGCKLDAKFKHVLTEQRNPCRSVGLLEVAPGGQRRTAIEYTNIIQTKKTTLKQVVAVTVFAVHPPAEVQCQLPKGSLSGLQDTLDLERLHI